jgi:hypothetical protein
LPSATRCSRQCATPRSNNSLSAWPTGCVGCARDGGTPTGERRRLRAVGQAYLDFAGTEPGLFDTAFTATDYHPPGAGNAEPGPFDLLKAALDELVEAGLLEPARTVNVAYPTWATVHGLAVLFRGPLHSLSDRDKTRLEAQALAFIEASLSCKHIGELGAPGADRGQPLSRGRGA